MRAAVFALGLCATAASAQPSLLAEDFEQGIDAGAGQRWVFVSQFGSTMTLSPQAAHRGDAGFRVTDTDGGAGSITNSNLIAQLGTATEGSWARGWVRAVVNTPGQATFFMLGFAGNPPQARQQVVSVTPDGGTAVGGFNASMAGYDVVGTAQPAIADGGWHLVELGWLGVGTRDGGRVLYVDGQLSSSVSHLDFNWGQQPAQEFRIGEPYEDDARFTGRFDFDDVRVSATPPGSRLSLRVVTGPVREGQCVVMGARLTSSSDPLGPSVSWPIDVRLAVSSGAGVSVFSDAACGASGPIDIAAGTGERTFSVRASQAGASSVTAQFVDFLPVTLAMLFSAAPDAGVDAGSDAGVDAGLDGGSNDAGVDAGVDGGVDAGASDAGLDAGVDAGVDAGSDAGVADGGTNAGIDGGLDAGIDGGVTAADGGTGPGVLPDFGVGCGCQSAPSLAWLLAALALWRRRAPKR